MFDKVFSTGLELEENVTMGVGFAFSLSFLVTAVALLVGSWAAPGAHVPQTVQMFLINVLCDGVTLLLTFVILGAAVERVNPGRRKLGADRTVRTVERKYSIPVAVALDLAVAALLACLSLYLGLLGSQNAVSIKEVLHVLVALSLSGVDYELGPYFWVMHTTFLPTLVYLTVIALAYIGKLIVLPVFHVLRKGHELDKPHDLTAATFAFAAALCLVFANFLGRVVVE